VTGLSSWVLPTLLHLQTRNVLFARLIGMHSPFLELSACNFTEKNMKSKDKGDDVRNPWLHSPLLGVSSLSLRRSLQKKVQGE
jgi:hypothetical protein